MRFVLLSTILLPFIACQQLFGEEGSAETEPLALEIISPALGTIFNDEILDVEIILREPAPPTAMLEVSLNDAERGFVNADLTRPTRIKTHVTGLETGKHALTVALRDRETLELIDDDRVVFYVTPATTWVESQFSVVVESTECRAGDQNGCRLSIIEHHNGPRPRSKLHHFLARMRGPSLVKGNVSWNETSDQYDVFFYVTEPGEYDANIWLEYVDGSALSLDDRVCTAGFAHRELKVTENNDSSCKASPTQETCSADEQSSSSGICTGLEASRGLGRWVNASQCGLISPHGCGGANILTYPYEKKDDFIWVPFGCVLKPYHADDILQALLGQQRKMVIVGNSLMRTIYFDTVRVMNATVSSNNWKPLEETFGNPMVLSHVGGVPADTDHVPNAQSVKYSTSYERIKMASDKYADTPRDILVLSLGFNEICGELVDLEVIRREFDLMGKFLASLPCQVVWMLPSGYHDRQHDMSHFLLTEKFRDRRSTSPKVDLVNSWAREIMAKYGIPVFDSSVMTSLRPDLSSDGIHFFTPGGYMGNAVSQTLTQSLMNALFNDNTFLASAAADKR